MSKGRRREITRLDPQSQGFVNRLRGTASSGAADILGQQGSFFTGPVLNNAGDVRNATEMFLNPFLEGVEGGVNSTFDRLRGDASVQARSDATRAGAFGGDRSGILEAVRLGELDRAQTEQIAGLRAGAFDRAQTLGIQQTEHNRLLREQQLQEPLFRHQQALGLMNLGIGPTGSETFTRGGGNLLGTLLGGATTLSGLGGLRGIFGSLLGGGGE